MNFLTVKENKHILDYNVADYSLEKATATVGSAENRALEREIASAAVTVIKNKDNVLPLNLSKNSRVLMLVPYENECAQMVMGWNRAKEVGTVPKEAEINTVRFNENTTVESLKTHLEWADTVIINSEVSSTSKMEYKHWLSALPNNVVNYCEENGKISIISSVNKPYDVQLYPNADAIVATYGCKGSSVDPTEALVGGVTGSKSAYGPNIIAAVEVILGTYGAQGTLPVIIPEYDIETNSYNDKIVYYRGYGLKYDSKAIDKSKLDELLSKIEALDKNEYTPESWDTLENALESTENSVNEGFYSYKDQQKVDELVKSLENAMMQLVEKNQPNPIQVFFIKLIKIIVFLCQVIMLICGHLLFNK